MFIKIFRASFLSKGVRIGIHTPWISHLFFADDCIIFTQASGRGANRLNDILEAYNRGLGQSVNRLKSAIFSVRTAQKMLKEKFSKS
jgi:hypothetical protein